MARMNTAPQDRTKTEHLGLLEKVVWPQPGRDEPTSILALVGGTKVVVDAPADSFIRGQRYRFLGRWEEGSFGPQFRAGTFVHDNPHSKPGILKYLSDVCSGVGAKIAEKLWQEFGPDAVKVLREEPDRVIQAGVMGAESAREAARELARFVGLEKTRVDLFGLFSGRGFSRKLPDLAISKWGAAAPERIRRDPYCLLMGGLPGCGFKRCDKLYLALGLRPNALKRQALAGWSAIRDDRSGSTWVPAQTVVSAVRDAVPGAADPVRAVKLGIRGKLFRIRRDGDKRWLAVAEAARAEQRVHDAIRRLNTADPIWPTEIAVSQAEGDGQPSAHQVEQLRRAMSAAVGCFIGGPGSGKTHSLSFVIRLIISTFGEHSVAVCAPTGKAAVRATESLAARGLPLKATTIHRLLEIGRNGHDGGGWGFNRNRDNPLSQRFLIVDETSMVDVSLMADFLDACQVGTHVMFVGDTFQLPPVGHGAPLRDFLAADLAQGELTEIRRNAGLIVRACAEIKAGGRPTIGERLELGAADPVNVAFIECRPAECLNTIEDTLKAMSKFDPIWDTQVLVATNEKSDASRTAVNARLGKSLNPDGRRSQGIPFAVGDKIICLSNSRLRAATPIGAFGDPRMAEDAGYYQSNADSEEVFVANGECGRVVAVGTGGMVVSFGDLAQLPSLACKLDKQTGEPIPLNGLVTRPRTVWVPKSKQKAQSDDGESGGESGGGAMGDFDPAWAITGHKSQGGEWPVVIIVADKAGGAVADRNWWYTAISRARTACLIVGDRAAFEAQIRRQSLAHRKTFLAEDLRTKVVGPALSVSE